MLRRLLFSSIGTSALPFIGSGAASGALDGNAIYGHRQLLLAHFQDNRPPADPIQSLIKDIRNLPEEQFIKEKINAATIAKDLLFAIAIDEQKFKVAQAILMPMQATPEKKKQFIEKAILEIRTSAGARKLIEDYNLTVGDTNGSLLQKALSAGKFASIPALLSVTPLNENIITKIFELISIDLKPLAGAVLIHALRHSNNDQASKAKDALIKKIESLIPTTLEFKAEPHIKTSLREYWNNQTKSYDADAKPLLDRINKGILTRSKIEKSPNMEEVAGAEKIELAIEHGYHTSDVKNKINNPDWEFFLNRTIIKFINENNLEALKSLIAEFNVDIKTFKLKAKTREDDATETKLSCFSYSIAKDRREIANYLFPHSDINAIDDVGNTALGYAVANKDFALIQKLIDAGADPVLAINSKIVLEPKNTQQPSHPEVAKRILLNQSIFARQKASSQQILDATNMTTSTVTSIISQYEIGEIDTTLPGGQLPKPHI